MSNLIDGERRRERKLEFLIPFFMIAVIALPLLLQIQNLGIYPDAVNPDYLAVRMLHGGHSVAWILPGNLIGHHFPILAGGLYHGSLHAYLAAPFLLLGARVVSFQISHLFLALLVATALFALLRRLSGTLLLPTAVCGLALLDPAFTYSFFTQAYITTFPDVFVLLACLLLLREENSGGITRRYLAIGALLGFAIWGYFIYTFFLPGLFLYVFVEESLRKAPRARILAKLSSLATGVAFGCVLYLVGYGLLFHNLGIQGGLDWLGNALGGLPQLKKVSGFSLVDRFGYVAGDVLSVLTSHWHAVAIFAVGQMTAIEIAKAAVLIVVPLAALPFASENSLSARGYRLIGVLLLSFLGVALVVGHKIAGHHFCALVPIVYALFGASIVLLGQHATFINRGLRTSASGAVLAALAATNVFYLESFSWRILNGESARLYSREVNAYPFAARETERDYTHVFMTWGTILPFVYLTKGKMPAFEADQLPGVLCQNTPLKLVFAEEHAVDDAKATLDRLKLTGTVENLSPPADAFQFAVATVEAPTTPRCGG